MKVLKSLLLFLFCSVILITSAYMIVPPLANDIALRMLERELLSLPLPPSTEILEIRVYCGDTGNISTTGVTGSNSGGLWAGAVLQTSLTRAEILEYYGAESIADIFSGKVNGFDFPGFDKSFDSLRGRDDYDGCYLLYIFGNAPFRPDKRLETEQALSY